MKRSGGYDAFVSYSHAEDNAFSAALQSGIERFARPWYRPRALRIFRDTTSLSATPGLWSDIVMAMRDADWFILVASKQAASSRWVGQEAAWWLANKGPKKFLIALAEGTIEWGGSDFDWQRTDCLPEQLSGAFAEEPNWVDLRDVKAALAVAGVSARRSSARSRLRGRQVRDQVGNWVADLAAPIRGVKKDELVGEHIRQRRRTRRTVQAMVSLLVTLTVSALVAAAIAVGQRDVAVAQTRVATAGEAAAVAVANLQTHLNIAELLAVSAYKMDSTAQTEAALFQAADASPQLERYLQVGAPVSALGTSSDGNVAVAGTDNGNLAWFNLATGKHLDVKALSGTVDQVSVSANGGTVVASDGVQAVVWHAVPGRRPQVLGKASSAAVSASGEWVAMINAPDGTYAPSWPLTVRNLGSGQQVQVRVGGEYLEVTFSGPSAVTVLNGGGPFEKLALPGLRQIAVSSAFLAPAGGYITAIAPNGNYSAYDKFGNVLAWRTYSPGTRDYLSGLGGFAPNAPATALAISSDGRSVAAVESGTIYVGSLSQSIAKGSGTALYASADTSAVAFLGSDNRLVSAADDTLQLWNLSQNSRLGRPTGIAIPAGATVGYPPDMQFSPNGRLLAIANNFNTVSVYAGLRTSAVAKMQVADLPFWDGDQLRLVGPGPNGAGLRISTDRGQVIRQWDTGQSAGDVVSMRLLPGGTRLAVLDQESGINVYNLLTGAVRRIRPDGSPSTSSVFPQQGDISPNGSSAAFSTNGSGQVVYVNLITGASHVVGSGAADGVLFAGKYLFIQRRTGVLQVWGADASKLVKQVPGSGGYAYALAVSPSGLLAARLSDDGILTVTSLATGDTLATLDLPFPQKTIAPDPWNATSLTFTPSGQSLLSASTGGELVRWDINPADLARIACHVAGQRMTAAEWEFYVHASAPSVLAC